MNRWCLSITIAAMTFCPNWALAQAFPADTTYTSPRGGLTIRPLVGPDISWTDAFEMAEIIFPAGYRGGNRCAGARVAVDQPYLYFWGSFKPMTTVA